MKKKPENIIILHNCTKNHDHMLHCSWDMMCDGCTIYLFILGYFCPFNPLTTQKIKIFLKWKQRYHHFTRVPKIMVTWPMVPEIWCITYRRTDGWKKWHLELGVPPKNLQLFSNTLAIWLRHHLKMSYCNCCNFVHSGVSQCMPSMHTSTSAHRKLFRISICALTKIM